MPLITSYLGLLVVFSSTGCLISCTRTSQAEKKTNQYEGYEHWNDLGRKELDEAMGVMRSINTNVAKNSILFIGDGMSNPTISAARILKGIQEKNPYPEKGYFGFERFPHLGRIKVLNPVYIRVISYHLNQITYFG